MPRKPAKKQSFALVWRGIRCRVRLERDYISKGWSHLEVEALDKAAAPLPITETGYLSHFLDEDELAGAGGPVDYVTAWLDREAATKAYAKTLAAWRQLDLFQ